MDPFLTAILLGAFRDVGVTTEDAAIDATVSVGVTRFEQLPINARLYLQRIEHATGVPIHVVSTSPDRDHTIMVRHPFLA